MSIADPVLSDQPSRFCTRYVNWFARIFPILGRLFSYWSIDATPCRMIIYEVLVKAFVYSGLSQLRLSMARVSCFHQQFTRRSLKNVSDRGWWWIVSGNNVFANSQKKCRLLYWMEPQESINFWHTTNHSWTLRLVRERTGFCCRIYKWPNSI